MTSIPQDRPVYRLGADFFGPDDTLYYGPCAAHPDGQVIVWRGEPNEDMEPLNDLAREALTEYSSKLDRLAQEKAAKEGKTFLSRPRGKSAQLQETIRDAHRMRDIESIGGVKHTPLFGADNSGNGVEVIAAASSDRLNISEVGGDSPARRRGRPALGA